MSSHRDCCDICGRSLTPRDFEKGRAVILLKKVWCRPCGDRIVERSKERQAEKAARAVPPSPLLPTAKTPAKADAVRALAPGDHACLFYSTEAQRAEQLGRFLSQGLVNREKVVYALDQGANDLVLGYVRAMDLPADRYLHRGQLEIHSTGDLYAPGGRFDPPEVISRIKILGHQAAREGYRGLRGTGEMTWGLRGWPGSERLVEYELRLTSVLAETRSIALCQYDSSRFSSELLKQIKLAHPIMLPAAAG